MTVNMRFQLQRIARTVCEGASNVMKRLRAKRECASRA
jgi:hypothetical protein